MEVRASGSITSHPTNTTAHSYAVVVKCVVYVVPFTCSVLSGLDNEPLLKTWEIPYAVALRISGAHVWVWHVLYSILELGLRSLLRLYRQSLFCLYNFHLIVHVSRTSPFSTLERFVDTGARHFPLLLRVRANEVTGTGGAEDWSLINEFTKSFFDQGLRRLLQVKILFVGRLGYYL